MDHEYYEMVSERIMTILRGKSTSFEQASIDEAYLDISEISNYDFAAAGKLGQEFKSEIFEKEKLQLLRGPYGPYIKQGLRNFKIPKEKQEAVADLTVEEIKAIIEEVKANPPKRVPKRKKTG